MNGEEIAAPFRRRGRGKLWRPKQYTNLSLPVPWPHWFFRQLIKVEPSSVLGHEWFIWGNFDMPEFENYQGVVSGARALELSAPSLWMEEEVGFFRLTDGKADLKLWADDGAAGLRVHRRSKLLPAAKRICQPTFGLSYTGKVGAIWVLQDAPPVSVSVANADLIDVLTVISAVTNDAFWILYDGDPFQAWTLDELKATRLDGSKIELHDVPFGLMSLMEWSAGLASVEAVQIHTAGDEEFRAFTKVMSTRAPEDPSAPAIPLPLALRRTSDRSYLIETRKGESSKWLIHLLNEFQKPLGWVLSGDGLP